MTQSTATIEIRCTPTNAKAFISAFDRYIGTEGRGLVKNAIEAGLMQGWRDVRLHLTEQQIEESQL